MIPQVQQDLIMWLLKMEPAHLVELQMVERSRAVGITQRQLLRTEGSETQALSWQETKKLDVGTF